MLSLKLINDPVYGFIPLQFSLIEALVAHPYFQRLRLIKQLSLASLVYPGAVHTRFNHSLGTMHLMHRALTTLSGKGHKISQEELEGAMAAALLHDIGHGPFSHSLEHSFIDALSHEELSIVIVKRLNKILNNRLELAIAIFTNSYPRPFFHQLIASQFDVDRMDYLNRDSFFTGVADGIINFERLITTLNLHQDTVVMESKGLNSLENFMISRHIMYEQVYLYKTVVAAEHMLTNILKRARQIYLHGEELYLPTDLEKLLFHNITLDSFHDNKEYLQAFLSLDDSDLWVCIKHWAKHRDSILATLCSFLINRCLYKIVLQTKPIATEEIETINQKLLAKYPQFKGPDFIYASFCGQIVSDFYTSDKTKEIKILFKKSVEDFSDVSSIAGQGLFKQAIKYFFCHLPV